MKNTLINKAIIKRIAVALGELNEKVIYVGGATVSLYNPNHAFIFLSGKQIYRL